MTADTGAAVARHSPDLLLVGALTGPVFFVSVIVQVLSRDGFDITRHAISQLANGDVGWIQVVTFVLAGLGSLALASGARAALTEGVGRRALPVLIGFFGIGLVIAGVFTTDPENGFPVGTAQGAARMSWHGVVHSAAAAAAFTALAAAAGVLAFRCARRRALPAAGLGGVVALILMLPVSADHMSIQIAVNGVIAFSWTTALALWLRRCVQTAYLDQPDNRKEVLP